MNGTYRSIAASTGVDKQTVFNITKRLGIDHENMSDEEYAAVMKEALLTADYLNDSAKVKEKISKDFKPNVRRIDQSEDSSVVAMLQDCKEQYVANQELIGRLQYELKQQDTLFKGHRNGTFAVLPQVGMIERMSKVNISLRNQIMALEAEIGRNAKPEDEDNPFK